MSVEMTSENFDDCNDPPVSEQFPQRDQYPQYSYRGYLRRKYEWLMAHPAKRGMSVAYYGVYGALNDSTTEQAREYLRRKLGLFGEDRDKIYLDALRELDEEEKERNRLMEQEF
jgi:hypothetical protein